MCRGERSGHRPSQRVTLCPAMGPTRCNVLVQTMCLLLATALDSGLAWDLNQNWREITPRIGGGSGKSCARLSCPHVWRSGCRGSLHAPFKCDGGRGEAIVVVVWASQQISIRSRLFLGPRWAHRCTKNTESSPDGGCIGPRCSVHPRWIYLERRECNPIDRVVLSAKEGGNLIALCVFSISWYSLFVKVY